MKRREVERNKSKTDDAQHNCSHALANAQPIPHQQLVSSSQLFPVYTLAMMFCGV